MVALLSPFRNTRSHACLLLSVLAVSGFIRQLEGFLSHSAKVHPLRIERSSLQPRITIKAPGESTNSIATTTTTRLYNKLWDRLQVEEDEEPHWYLVNCVAGLEMDLLRQCREVCRDLTDAYKFVVPTEIKTRSHGANRMVTETKVKYQGYVFAKLRLCPDVYEAIQGYVRSSLLYFSMSCCVKICYLFMSHGSSIWAWLLPFNFPSQWSESNSAHSLLSNESTL